METLITWTFLLVLFRAVLASSGDPVITYKNFDEQNAKTWKAAKEACSNSNSTLALLDTQKKIDAVKDSLSRGEYWIGLRYHGGRFVWSTGAIADESFVNNLYSGNRNSLQNSGKTCFLLKTTGRPPFKKERCDKRHGFICQITGEGPSVAANNASGSIPAATLASQSVIVSSGKLTPMDSGSTIESRFAANSVSVSLSSDAAAQSPRAGGPSPGPKLATLAATMATISGPQNDHTHPEIAPSSAVRTGEYSDASAQSPPGVPSPGPKLATLAATVATISGPQNDHTHLEIAPSSAVRTGEYSDASVHGSQTTPLGRDSVTAASPEQHNGEVVSSDEKASGKASPTASVTGQSLSTAALVRGSQTSPPSGLAAEQSVGGRGSVSVTSTGRHYGEVTASDEKVPTKVSPTASLQGRGTASLANQAVETMAVKQMLQRMESLDVGDPGSINGAANIWSECVELVAKSTSSNNISSSTFMCAQGLESFVMEYAGHHLNSTSNSMLLTNDKLTLKLSLVTQQHKEGFVFSRDGVYVHLPFEIFRDQDKFVYTVVYHDLHESVGTHGRVANQKALTLNAHVTGVGVSPSDGHRLSSNVTLAFQHIKGAKTNQEAKCAYWDFSTLRWSSSGCSVVATNASDTACSCNHLTNFAVLMQTRETEVSPAHTLALELMTYIGLGLSLVGELITLVSYFVAYSVAVSLRDQQEEQLVIRRNLVASLAMAQILFLTGIGAVELQVACVIVAALIHYFYLVAFCWMLIEGVYLYIMLVKVYQAEIRVAYCRAFAFGTPAVIVGSTLFIAKFHFGQVDSYINSYVCWISFDNYLIWSFIGPVILIEVTNLVLLFRVLKEMASMQRMQVAEMYTLRQSFKACVVLCPLLGVTWLFGLLSLLDSGVTIQYIFTLLNSMQIDSIFIVIVVVVEVTARYDVTSIGQRNGFLIFVFHCLRNSQIRAACGRKLEKWLESKSVSGGGAAGGVFGQRHSRVGDQPHSSGIGMVDLLKRQSKVTPVELPPPD